MNAVEMYKGMAFEYKVIDPEKPTIVFLHDSLGSIVLWRDFPQKIAQELGCNYLIYDRIGYGKSDPMLSYERPVDYLEKEAVVLDDFFSYLKLNAVVLFGHSDGGSIALIYAARYPDKVKGVICEAGHIFVEEKTLQGIKNAIAQYESTNLSLRLSKYHGEKTETIFKAWTLTWTSDDFRNWNIENLLSDIVCPLLFIQGDLDEYGTLIQVENTINKVSGNAQKFIVYGSGHTPHKEFPSETLSEAVRFIKNL